MPYTLSELLKQASMITTQHIMCGACFILKKVTAKDDQMGHFFAGNVCFMCSLMFGRDAYNYYDSVFFITRRCCKFLNTCSRWGLIFFGSKNGGDSSANDQCPAPIGYGTGMYGEGI